MIGNRYSINFFLPISALLALQAAAVAQAGQLTEVRPHIVEVLTTTESPVMGETVVNRLVVQGEMEFHVYDLDGIQSIEAKLSEGLTADPEQAKRVVLQRFQQLHEEDRAQMQRAAMGLAKAMQYGIDRYPAIVFDGEVAIYGVTDVGEALRRYQEWREGRMR
ncbi:MAG: TIGR03757 family integrating conjugative element protein [Pseudomonadota bacterium]|nr:TIGR03757 family integrating conjugative element protein [Pseudomonadota bacterium]